MEKNFTQEICILKPLLLRKKKKTPACSSSRMFQLGSQMAWNAELLNSWPVKVRHGNRGKHVITVADSSGLLLSSNIPIWGNRESVRRGWRGLVLNSGFYRPSNHFPSHPRPGYLLLLICFLALSFSDLCWMEECEECSSEWASGGGITQKTDGRRFSPFFFFGLGSLNSMWADRKCDKLAEKASRKACWEKKKQKKQLESKHENDASQHLHESFSAQAWKDVFLPWTLWHRPTIFRDQTLCRLNWADLTITLGRNSPRQPDNS